MWGCGVAGTDNCSYDLRFINGGYVPIGRPALPRYVLGARGLHTHM
jgi:hypothetical protein